jgi:hypothetical protein
MGVGQTDGNDNPVRETDGDFFDLIREGNMATGFDFLKLHMPFQTGMNIQRILTRMNDSLI